MKKPRVLHFTGHDGQRTALRADRIDAIENVGEGCVLYSARREYHLLNIDFDTMVAQVWPPA